MVVMCCSVLWCRYFAAITVYMDWHTNTQHLALPGQSTAFFQVKMPHHSLLPWFVLLQNNSMLYLTTKLHFLNSLKFLRSEKHSPKTFLFLLISNVHFMCRIDSYFLLNLSDPQQPTG